jgi:large subunit ribosomal protein L24
MDMRIRVDDVVLVIAGADRGLRGKVLSVLRGEGKVVVEGANRAYRHIRRSQKNPQGGRLSKEMPIDASNVQLICNSCGRPTRVGARFADDGSKVRFCKSCDAVLNTISPARKAHVKK